MKRVQGKAQYLADGLADLVKQMQYQHKYLNESLEEVHEVTMPERIQQVADLEKNIKATKTSLAELCQQHNLSEPDLPPEPPISKETLKTTINRVLIAGLDYGCNTFCRFACPTCSRLSNKLAEAFCVEFKNKLGKTPKQIINKRTVSKKTISLLLRS